VATFQLIANGQSRPCTAGRGCLQVVKPQTGGALREVVVRRSPGGCHMSNQVSH
jgi:hypothetical protein